MSNFFERIKKLGRPQSARSFNELTPVFKADDVKACIEACEEELNDVRKSLDIESTTRVHFEHVIDSLNKEITELHRQRFREYNEEEYIIFFDNGEDYPESMVAPVVMSASKFRELFAAREKIKQQDQGARTQNEIVLAGIDEFLRRAESTMTMGDWAFTYSFNQDTADRVKKEMGLSEEVQS